VTTYRCEQGRCAVTITHIGNDDCEHVNGWCARMVEAGWHPVRVHVLEGDGDNLLFARGGWLCPEHAP